MSQEIQNSPSTLIDDPFGIRMIDFSIRVPERSEMFNEVEARTYIEGCDYPESADDLLLAIEIQNRFGPEAVNRARILDAMCGPGRLGKELLVMGAEHVSFHDGHQTMLDHAGAQASAVVRPWQTFSLIKSDVEAIPVADNSFDLVVCHNSIHQLHDEEKLRRSMAELLRVTAAAGHLVIADYQRSMDPGFADALEERLKETREDIVPLLVPTFQAAFSKTEFATALDGNPEVASLTIIDGAMPEVSELLQLRVDADPVKGHVLDFSPISQRVIVRKVA